LEEPVTAVRDNAKEKQSSEANISYKAISAQCKKTLNASVRDSWVKKKTNPQTWIETGENYVDLQKS
jgi:hypothetical protein